MAWCHGWGRVHTGQAQQTRWRGQSRWQTRWLVPVLCTLSLGLACDEFQDAVEEAVVDEDAPTIPPPPPADEDKTAQASPETLAAAKAALYAECLWTTFPALQRSRTQWEATVGADGTPIKRRTVPALSPVGDTRQACETADRDGPIRPPAQPSIEGPAATYLDALRQIALHSAALATYYDNKEYAQDAWAKGKTLAPLLAGAFARGETAGADLAEALDTLQASLDQALLAQAMAEHGKNIQWHARATVIAARAWVKCIAPVEQPIEACDGAMAEVMASSAGFATRRQAHPDEAAAVFWLTSFAHSAAQLRTTAERLHAGPATDTPKGTKSKSKRRSKRSKTVAPKVDRTTARDAFATLVVDYGQLRF